MALIDTLVKSVKYQTLVKSLAIISFLVLVTMITEWLRKRGAREHVKSYVLEFVNLVNYQRDLDVF